MRRACVRSRTGGAGSSCRAAKPVRRRPSAQGGQASALERPQRLGGRPPWSQCWMSRKTAAGAYHTFYGMFAVTCSVRLRSPYRRDSWEIDPGSNPGNISSQWRLWAGKWAHVLLNPASITLLVFCEDSLAPRRAHYKVAVTSIKDALENTLCALLFLVVSNLAIIRFVN